jgi:hypothetical protein
MKNKKMQAIVIVASLFVSVGIALAQQDRYTVKALNGVSFSELAMKIGRMSP